MNSKKIKLENVWHTCNKIRDAVYRTDTLLWRYFYPLDPNKSLVISESEFISVFIGPLQAVVGLSNKEISDLADYLRIQDGRISYDKLCEVIYDCGVL